MAMTSKQRTLLAVGLFLPLAAVLLVTFACLPVPVGDPAKAKVDATLPGVFKLDDVSAKDPAIYVLRAWDEHTYFLQCISASKDGDKSLAEVMDFKGWLTDIGGVTFLTFEPVDLIDQEKGEAAPAPVWIVFRMEKTATGMNMRMVKGDSEPFKGLEGLAKEGKAGRADAEAIIKAHLNDDSIYSDKLTYKRLGKDDAAYIADVMNKANLKLGMH